jgi:hypothetical protein
VLGVDVRRADGRTAAELATAAGYTDMTARIKSFAWCYQLQTRVIVFLQIYIDEYHFAYLGKNLELWSSDTIDPF